MRIGIVILSYNRREALARTLAHVSTLGAARITVVDNASTDGTVEMVQRDFPTVETLPLPANIGVAAFNRGVAATPCDAVLILDDDAWPEAETFAAAVAAMEADATLGAVALLPTHPVTNEIEWPVPDRPRDDWPILGCGNLIRTEAWNATGGYEESFFLYRNDADLALKLLSAGWKVRCDPSLIVWHDSPAASRKSDRWLHLATRNWIWMTRRHAKGSDLPLGIAAGAAWAAKLAGADAGRLKRVGRGVLEGLGRAAPPLPPGVPRTGAGYRALLSAQFRRRLGKAS